MITKIYTICTVCTCNSCLKKNLPTGGPKGILFWNLFWGSKTSASETQTRAGCLRRLFKKINTNGIGLYTFIEKTTCFNPNVAIASIHQKIPRILHLTNVENNHQQHPTSGRIPLPPKKGISDNCNIDRVEVLQLDLGEAYPLMATRNPGSTPQLRER